MKEIKLTKGQYALVDDEDYANLNQFRWQVNGKGKPGNSFYAVRGINGQGQDAPTVRMHREIMEAKKGQIVDHIDGNSLNNQRSNLRFCTTRENALNSKHRINNTSGYRGVSWNKQIEKWSVDLWYYGKKVHMGYFIDKERAVDAYKKAAKEHYGKFSPLSI